MKRILLFLALIVGLSSNAIAQELSNDARKEHYNLGKKELAIKGYDPVSYFMADAPEKGSSKLTHEYKGVIYRFASQENLDTFKATPDAYEPHYGGWCAYAMGETGEKVSINPKTYKIVDGKLYLFYKTVFVNTLTKWNKDETRLQTDADKNWSEIISQ